MSDYLDIILKSDTRQVLDLRPDAPTFTQTLTVATARFFCMENDLDNNGWYDAWKESRSAKLDRRLKRAQAVWDAWENRPALFLHEAPTIGGSVRETESVGCCFGDYQYPPSVGRLIEVPRSWAYKATGSRATWAIVSDETYMALVQTINISAGTHRRPESDALTVEVGDLALPVPAWPSLLEVVNHTADEWREHISTCRAWAYPVGPELPGSQQSWRVRYAFRPPSAAEMGTPALKDIFREAEVTAGDLMEGARLKTSCVDMEVGHLIRTAQQHRQTVGIGGGTAQYVECCQEQTLRVKANDYLRERVVDMVDTVKRAVEDRQATLDHIQEKLTLRAGYSNALAVEEALPSLLADEEQEETARTALEAARLAVTRQERLVTKGAALIEDMRFRLYVLDASVRFAAAVDQFKDLPAVAYRALTQEQWAYIHVMADKVRSDEFVQAWDGTSLRYGDFFVIPGHAPKQPSRWAGFTKVGTLYAKHYPTTSAEDLSALITGLSDQQRDRAQRIAPHL